MKGEHRRAKGKGPVELIEEAFHLVRTAPTRALAWYYSGTAPFVVGLLCFWTDMRRSAYAEGHVAEATLGIALLFVWMKFCQALFAQELSGVLAGAERAPLGWRRAARVFLGQGSLQPTGLFLMPLAAVVVLPFGWALAFYQNLTALAGTDEIGPRGLVRSAWQQAKLWPAQNHVLGFLLGAFGVGVFLNWATVCYMLPGLVKTSLGVESAFTRSDFGMLNSTFLAAMLSLTYLCVDPIAKAVYVERCFYGRSLQSGEDLRVELSRLSQDE